jgi:hypothetical protein
VADATSRVPTLADGLLPFPKVADRRKAPEEERTIDCARRYARPRDAIETLAQQ